MSHDNPNIKIVESLFRFLQTTENNPKKYQVLLIYHRQDVGVDPLRYHLDLFRNHQ